MAKNHRKESKKISIQMNRSERILPSSIEVEKAILSILISFPDSVLEIADSLTPEMFYKDANSIIYRAILELVDKSQVINALSIVETLRKNQELEKAGGFAYIAEIADISSSPADLIYYVNLLKEKTILRELISVSSSIIDKSYEPGTQIDTLIDWAEEQIFRIRIKKEKIEKTTEAKFTDVLKKFEEISRSGRYLTGIPSGFIKLDEITMGFQPGELTIVASRPSVGKTSFVLNIAENVALGVQGNGRINPEEAKPILIFSLEMPEEQIVSRLLCTNAKVERDKIIKGRLSQQEWKLLTNSAEKLGKSQIFIDDSGSLNTLEMKAKARRFKSRYGIKLIIVDYLQLVNSHIETNNRYEQITYVSQALKAMAKELNVPVIACSQLARYVERRDDRKPQLSDLKESGSIEQDADLVLMIYRKNMYLTEEEIDPKNMNLAEIIIAKNRNGPLGTVKLNFFKEFTYFSDRFDIYDHEDI